MIGRTLEHYRIDAKLGEGGMGVVYKAHDSRLNRTVAIKVLPPERVADPDVKQRGEPVQITKDGGFVSQESPDGAYLYFAASPAVGALLPLWRAPTAGGPAVKLLDGILNSAFAVLDRGIYYIDQASMKPALSSVDDLMLVEHFK